jgi:hypothetical protein
VFSENVGPALSAGDLLLENLTTGLTIDPATMLVAYDAGANVATITFPGQPDQVLPDGNYRATIAAAGVTDIAGNALASDHVMTFFFLQGDANRDARVNLGDFNILAANFGQSGRDFTHGDFNYDGTVNLSDFNILAGRFGQVLAPPSPGATGPAATTRLIDEIDV